MYTFRNLPLYTANPTSVPASDLEKWYVLNPHKVQLEDSIAVELLWEMPDRTWTRMIKFDGHGR